jgi:hypothetical protein
MDMRAIAVDGTVKVTLVQEFETYVCPSCTWPTLQRTEAKYQLPLDEKAAVTEFFAEINGRLIEGIVKDKVEAKKDYEDAVDDGETAFLVEQTRPDVFEISCGNMPAGAVIRTTLVYVAPLEVFDADTYRFVIPTKIAPRYTPTGASSVPNDNNFLDEGVRITIGAVTSSKASITSTTHTLQTIRVLDTVITAEVIDDDPLDRDVVMEISIENVSAEPKVFLEYSKDLGTYAMLLSWVPGRNDVNDKAGADKEFVFILDRSGSMGDDNKITQLKEALKIILDELHLDSLFNFVGFGTSFEYLFQDQKSRLRSNSAAYHAAIDYIDNLAPNFGGTEILAPIKDVLQLDPTDADHDRVIILISDGQVSNEQEVINYVGDNLGSSQIFTIGIGPNVGRNLLNGIARNGKGTSDYVNGDDKLDIVEAVNRQMATASETSLLSIQSVTWGGMQGSVAPFEQPALFAGRRYLRYFLGNALQGPPTQNVVVSGLFSDGGVLQYDVTSDKFQDTNSVFGSTDMIHKLAARELIRDLEEGRSWMHANGNKPNAQDVKDEILEVALEHQILSSETSFVAIDEGGKTVGVTEKGSGDSNGGGNSGGGAVGAGPSPWAFCFPAESAVRGENGNKIAMKDLRIGDVVATGDNQFSRVYSFGHLDRTIKADYLELCLRNSRKPLVISESHMVLVAGGNFVRAGAVVVGDELVLEQGGTSTVTKVTPVQRVGAYAPFTESGMIAVNGVVSSSYVSLEQHGDGSYFLLGTSVKIVSMQWLAHAFQAPHRMICRHAMQWCENETYTEDGISHWVHVPWKVSQWLLGQPVAVSAVFSILVVMVGILLFVVETIHHFVAVLALMVLGLTLVRRGKSV